MVYSGYGDDTDSNQGLHIQTFLLVSWKHLDVNTLEELEALDCTRKERSAASLIQGDGANTGSLHISNSNILSHTLGANDMQLSRIF